jgi:hypothetical protein
MISVEFIGRLGNCLIQYSAARIFASEYGLSMNPESNRYIFKLAGSAVNLYLGSSSSIDHLNKKIIREADYLQLITKDSIDPAHYIIQDSFQDPNFVALFTEEIRETVRMPESSRIPNSVLCHVRLGDCDNSERRLPYGYYRDALKSLSFDTGVITSDSPDHPDVRSLAREFSLEISGLNPMQTLLSSNSYEKCVLSEGSFSWWIGLLSKAPQILINRRLRERPWHGDIFIFPEWRETRFCS